jgi:hypothetical protein
MRSWPAALRVLIGLDITRSALQHKVMGRSQHSCGYLRRCACAASLIITQSALSKYGRSNIHAVPSRVFSPA